MAVVENILKLQHPDYTISCPPNPAAQAFGQEVMFFIPQLDLPTGYI